LAVRDCSFDESSPTKTVDRVDSIGGIDRFLFVASLGCHARCRSGLDVVLSLVGSVLQRMMIRDQFVIDEYQLSTDKTERDHQ